MPAVSVIMPAYNEELTITPAIEDVATHVAAAAGSIEMIVVDDGSKDKTADIVTSLQAKHAFIKLVRQRNAGHGAALRTGIDAAKGDWLLLLDSDCQISLAGFTEQWARRNSFDAFLGVRLPRHDPAVRLVISKLMREALGLYAGVRPLDAGAPYKIVSRKAWERARQVIPAGSWIPSVLLAAFLIKDPEMRVEQTPIAHFKRPHGVSTLNAKRLLKFCRQAFTEIQGFGKAMKERTKGTHAAQSPG